MIEGELSSFDQGLRRDTSKFHMFLSEDGRIFQCTKKDIVCKCSEVSKFLLLDILKPTLKQMFRWCTSSSLICTHCLRCQDFRVAIWVMVLAIMGVPTLGITSIRPLTGVPWCL